MTTHQDKDMGVQTVEPCRCVSVMRGFRIPSDEEMKRNACVDCGGMFWDPNGSGATQKPDEPFKEPDEDLYRELPNNGNGPEPDEGSEGWPVVEMLRTKGRADLQIRFDLTPYSYEEVETYHPASAPNVLSPEQSRLVALALKSWAGPFEDDLQALRRDLETFAVKGDPDA